MNCYVSRGLNTAWKMGRDTLHESLFNTVEGSHSDTPWPPWLCWREKVLHMIRTDLV